MFSKSTLAVVSVVATTVLAQSYPADLSDSCLNFYKAFDADTTFKTCTSALNDATSGYSNSSSTEAPTKESITSTLKTVCTSTTTANDNDPCSDTAIRGKLAEFATACRAEFDAKRADVISTYDSLYAYSPLKTALCSKDDAGNYCVMSASTYASQNSALTEGVKQQLFSATDSTNLTAMGDANAPFLFLSPDLDAGKLCTVCTRNILTGYQVFAQNTPHAAGLANSELFKGEPALFQAVSDKCDANFLNTGASQGVGGIGKGSSKNGAFQVRAVDFVAVVAGVVSTAVFAAYL
ncbi:hypothetical protein PM082_019871 [Marasmius tenuissimus]|nr:hypothetical protein PM082_019871 [Marasmius tenuissimus]